MHYFIITFVIITQSCFIIASDGDRSPYYKSCVRTCSSTNCTEDGQKFIKAGQKQDFWSQVLQWSCREECQYHCMWKTVDAFKERGYNIPKFHGKWPFIRVFGVQEPASAISSLMNLAAHSYMHTQLRQQFSTDNNALVLFWNIFAGVCMHAWIWSTIFHTRDTPVTEFMDYACALSMVIALFVAAVIRVLKGYPKVTVAILLSTVFYYLEHVRYLYSDRVDYDYNMTVNIVFGVTGSILWLVWACYSYYSGHHYKWRLVAFIALSAAALSLELFDFPPRGGVWDAHAVWHLSTAPLPLIFYRFVIDDLKYLQTKKSDLKLP